MPTFNKWINKVNTESYSVSLLIQSKCGKIRTRKTPNTDTFHPVLQLKRKYKNLGFTQTNPKSFWTSHTQPVIPEFPNYTQAEDISYRHLMEVIEHSGNIQKLNSMIRKNISQKNRFTWSWYFRPISCHWSLSIFPVYIRKPGFSDVFIWYRKIPVTCIGLTKYFHTVLQIPMKIAFRLVLQISGNKR